MPIADILTIRVVTDPTNIIRNRCCHDVLQSPSKNPLLIFEANPLQENGKRNSIYTQGKTVPLINQKKES